MANQNYAHANAGFLKGEINWLTDNIKVTLLNPFYVGGDIAISNDIYFTSIASYVLTGASPVKTLTNKTVSVGSSYGVTNAGITVFNTIVQGQILGYVCFFKDPDLANIDGIPSSGNQGSSKLIHLIDSGYNIGMGTNGGDIQINWNELGIFKL
jgi:hypothetical protein